MRNREKVEGEDQCKTCKGSRQGKLSREQIAPGVPII